MLVLGGLGFIAGFLAYQYGPRAKILVAQTQRPLLLSEKQTTAIAEKAKLAAGADLEVASIVGDVEAKNLADEIAAVLRSVGWKVQQSTPFFREPGANELRIFVHDPDHPPAGADALMAALQAAGLPVSGAHLDQVQPGWIRLMIGERTPAR